MQGINKVILVGHLGQDPEVKTANNVTVANCSLATSERYKDKNTGEIKTITEWHKVVFFNKLADAAGTYLTKGSAIYIEGKIKTEKYTDRDGIERYATKIIANNLQMLGSKDKDKAESQQENNMNQNDDFNDDIPF